MQKKINEYKLLMSEWDYEKNKEFDPNQISYGSGKKVWWICPRCGQSYNMPIVNRTTRGSNCPICSKEIQTSFPEQAIYFYLKKIIKCNNREYVLGKELDIYIPSQHIGIEYNGSRYHQDKLKDLDKILYFKNKGIKIISINESNTNSIERDTINYVYYSNQKNLEWMIKELLLILNINKNVDVNIVRDSISIYEQYIISEKENCLYNKYPKISKEWDYEKNGKITPKIVRPNSNKKVWWICPLGHSYISTINNRTRGCGCPYCSGNKILKGFNDLKSQNTNLVKEWDYEKNEIYPDCVTINTAKVVWWVCPQGHNYKMRISHRTAGSSCPICAIEKRMKTRNKNYITKNGSLEDNAPLLAQEWDYEKNKMKPSEVLLHSGKKVWWICPNGHSYQADPNHRSQGRGCPICYKNGGIKHV